LSLPMSYPYPPPRDIGASFWGYNPVKNVTPVILHGVTGVTRN